MHSPRGMTLIDVLVGCFLVLVIFLGLVGLLRASLLVSSLAKAKAGATAVATNQMEYVRSLPYDSVGTVGGIPSGLVPETSTTTFNGVPYTIRTFISYVDDAADGLDAADENGIITDYKRIKIAVTYTVKERVREMDLVSNEAPVGIETSAGGGTLKIIVVDATGAAVPGASVRIQNPSLSPVVDVTTFSSATGIVFLPGAATSTDYRVTVSKTGYSTAQTYARDATNQNPTPGYLTVALNQTTASTFAIDVLGALTFRTYYPPATAYSSDAFADATHLSESTNTSVLGGSLQLAVDAFSGSARATSTAPTYLASWVSASSTLSVPGGTDVVVRVADGTGTLIPDSVIPGNSIGFTTFPIDLSGVATSSYPALSLSAALSTNATSTTPTVDAWSITYQTTPIPVPNVSFTLTGNKTIGSTGAGAPIYKTTIASTTNSGGVRALSLEWDSYALAVSGYDVTEACTPSPYVVAPGANLDNYVYLAAATTNAVLISVRDNAGAVVSGASVTLSRTGYTSTVTTSSCGTAYFGGVTSASDYTVSATKTGYTAASATGVTVSGHSFYEIAFP